MPNGNWVEMGSVGIQALQLLEGSTGRDGIPRLAGFECGSSVAEIGAGAMARASRITRACTQHRKNPKSATLESLSISDQGFGTSRTQDITTTVLLVD